MISGTVPDSFRVVRELLDRLEDSKTGEVVKDFQSPIPPTYLQQAKDLVADIGYDLSTIPFHKDMKPTLKDPLDLYINTTWNASLTVLGQEGLPDGKVAGNVLRPFTSLTVSIRLPPNVSGEQAEKNLR